VSDAAPKPNSRGRALIYSIGPHAEGERLSPMTPSLRLLRFALAASAMFAVGLSGCALVVWLVLQPAVPTGVQPFPSHPVDDGVGLVMQQPAGMQDATTLLNKSAQRLRCAHNAASVR